MRQCLLAFRALAFWLLSLMALLAGPPLAAQTVVYPRAERSDDRRDDYPVELLTLALKKTGKPYTLQASPVFMLQVRAISELEHGQTVDVIWTMTSAERERTLLPVRIPIDRGLLGWRLLMVRETALPTFAALASPDRLKQMRGGQGFDWPDTVILKSAGYDIDASVRYEDLFTKLASGRIDYFPRSVQEIWGELDAHQASGFAVEPGLAIYYPAAMYFFVNPRQATLAADIQKGLEAALVDGSFEALFLQHFGPALKRAELGRRQVITLPNPLLPAQTPLANRRLWYQPAR